MLSLSVAANLAVHALTYLAASGADRPVSASQVAAELKVSPSHLSKVMQALAREGLLHSTRGAAGGFRLAADPQKVTLLEIVEAVSGPLNREEQCILGQRICGGGRCRLSVLTGKVGELLNQELGRLTLAAFIAEAEVSVELAD